MPELEIRGYQDGKWVEAKAPDWFLRATDTDQDWTEAFRDTRVALVDDFDYCDSIQIYRATDRTFCVVFRDVHEVVLVVFIKSASDYIRFRAEIIEPNVMLMKESERLALVEIQT